MNHSKLFCFLFKANVIPYVHPLIRSHPNWTLDSEEFRSSTDVNSSVQNLLDSKKKIGLFNDLKKKHLFLLLATSGTFWCSTQNKDAWVIFDLKHPYNISGMRIIGS